MCRNANVLAVLVVLNVGRLAILIDDGPAFVLLVEIRSRRHLRVTHCRLTLGRMAVAEARRAAELVVHIEIEESRFALFTATSLDIVLAQTDARRRIARRRIVQ